MLNNDQRKIHDDALKNLFTGCKQVYEYGGAAGTGKTYTLYQICKDSGIPMNKILPMAYTGAAATILRKKGFINATTLHSGLFTPTEVPNPNYSHLIKESIDHQFGIPNIPKTILKFLPKKVLPGIELIVIDEGRMCPLHMKPIIESYGIPVIVTGDPHQLDPVGDKPAYLLGEYPELHELMRQDALSPIIYIAHRILNDEPIHTGLYGNKVLVIEDTDLTDNMILSSNLVLCGTNSTRDYWNNYIRENLLGFHGPLPHYGERLICRRNNHSIEISGISLANGLLGFAASEPDGSTFNKKTFYMDFLPDILEEPFMFLECDYEYFSAPAKVRSKYNNPFNKGEKFEYGYCITTHLSQGSEATKGIYIDEWLGNDIDLTRRLRYTGVTRFKDSMIYIKKHRKFY